MPVMVRFDRRGRWGHTLVCNDRIRDALQPYGLVHGRWPADGAAAPPPAVGDGLVRQVREATALFYFPARQGWFGLLCEAGEWIAVPAALRPWFETEAGPVQPPTLPTPEAFVERVLVLIGEEAVDAEPDA